jgi:hypothetical protein
MIRIVVEFMVACMYVNALAKSPIKVATILSETEAHVSTASCFMLKPSPPLAEPEYNYSRS